MNMKKLINFFSLFLLLFFFTLPSSVLAAGFSCICSDNSCASYPTSTEQQVNGLCVNKSGLNCEVAPGDCSISPASSSTAAKTPAKEKYVTKLENPLVGVYSVTDILGNVIKVAMSVMGGAVLLMVVKGAISWIDAGGSAEKIESGTKTIIWAILGAVLTVASYVTLKAIIDAFFHPLTQ